MITLESLRQLQVKLDKNEKLTTEEAQLLIKVIHTFEELIFSIEVSDYIESFNTK